MRICNHYNLNKIKQICKLDFAKHISVATNKPIKKGRSPHHHVRHEDYEEHAQETNMPNISDTIKRMLPRSFLPMVVWMT